MNTSLGTRAVKTLTVIVMIGATALVAAVAWSLAGLLTAGGD